MSLKNKVVVMTGGSSSMGRAICGHVLPRRSHGAGRRDGPEAPGRAGRSTRRVTVGRSCPSWAT